MSTRRRSREEQGHSRKKGAQSRHERRRPRSSADRPLWNPGGTDSAKAGAQGEGRSPGRREPEAAARQRTPGRSTAQSGNRNRRPKKSGNAAGPSVSGDGDIVKAAIGELIPIVGVRAACEALDVARASFYRKRGAGAVFPMPAAVRFVPRGLELAAREGVLACLHEERFQNCAPAAIYATLLDEGRYHCSIRTMYRILAGEGEARERRDQLVHPAYTKPELLATGPNQLWSWDITKLAGPAKWTYFYFYSILAVLSRYVGGEMGADGE